MVEATSEKLFEAAALNELIERFKREYDSFKSPKYMEEERNVKLKTYNKVTSLLKKENLQSLITEGRFEEVRNLLKKAHSSILINQFDSKPIYNGGAEDLSHAIFELLYGTEDFDARLEKWLNTLAKAPYRGTVPGFWPTATFLLMFQKPHEYIFIKPTPYRLLLLELKSKLKWESKPTPAFYRSILQLAHSLLEVLKPLGARDLIDVQSFIWVTTFKDEEESLLPGIWDDFAAYLNFALHLERDREYSAEELATLAQEFGSNSTAYIDPLVVAEELRQFRLIKASGEQTFTLQPYIPTGESTSLQRLMLLALLLPVAGAETLYELPSKKIMPRLLSGQIYTVDKFAPELGGSR